MRLPICINLTLTVVCVIYNGGVIVIISDVILVGSVANFKIVLAITDLTTPVEDYVILLSKTA